MCPIVRLCAKVACGILLSSLQGRTWAWRDMETKGRECSLVPGECLLLPGAAVWTENEWWFGGSVRLFARGRREKTQGEQCRAWKKPSAA